jgi:hypothetical protein
MDRSAGKCPPRSFVYVSDSKLAVALAQADTRSVLEMLPRLQTLGVNLGLFNATFGVPSPDLADRDHARAAARVATAEQHIQASYQVGDLAVGEQWVSGRVDMEWAPMGNGQTVLFCGYAGPLLVVLGGSLGNVYGSASSAERIGSYSHTIRTVVLNGDNPADLGHDLATITRNICHRPQSVRFLARVIERGKLPEGFGATRVPARHSALR